MRGLYSSKTEIRHKIFTEIARMAYEEQSPEEVLEELPYKIIPGDVPENNHGACADFQRCGTQYYRRKILRAATYQCDQIRL